ncbi:6-bladed beta-propeller [Bacteroides sp. UBA939]|uniref:6-bladed beta-propeller n=1 Tax=Bacteroides sp. UBA939 TaxID=1946092 RepID=UPI0025C6A595|nr:6-bladed beta-propeller [Bacteroides sp. UBA939]
MGKVIPFLLILLLLSGCNKMRRVERQLVLDTLITELSDSSLFSNNVSCIICVSGDICFADYLAGNIVVLDENLRLRCKVGKRGEGPGEVIGVVHFVRDKLDFHLLDEGSRSIKKYSLSGEHLSTVKIPRDISYAPWGRFLYLDSLFYLPNIKGTAVSVIGNDGQFIKRFGTDSEEVGGRILLSGGKSGLLAIGVASPTIEKYTIDGTLQESLDYGNFPMVKDITKDSHNSGNSFMAIVNDACLANERLYVLIRSQVLCFSLDRDIQLESIYLLPHNFYSSIAVWEGNLYGFNYQDSSIERFLL